MRSIHSHRAKYLISICRVRLVGFCEFPIAVHPLLSSYAIVAVSCGMSKSHNMLRINRHIRPTSHAAMNSASVDERATVGWNFVLYAMTPPARKIHTPVNERRVLVHVAQSKSAYATAMFGLCSGRFSRTRSFLQLLIGGNGPSLRSCRLLVRQ